MFLIMISRLGGHDWTRLLYVCTYWNKKCLLESWTNAIGQIVYRDDPNHIPREFVEVPIMRRNSWCATAEVCFTSWFVGSPTTTAFNYHTHPTPHFSFWAQVHYSRGARSPQKINTSMTRWERFWKRTKLDTLQAVGVSTHTYKRSDGSGRRG